MIRGVGYPVYWLPDPIPVGPGPVVCGPDMLKNGAAWLAGQLRRNATEPVIYRRGSAEVGLCATFGQTLLELSDEIGGVRMEWTDRDFIVPGADLVLGGTVVRPTRGDLILHDDGAAVHTYGVLPYGTEPHWRWSDPFMTLVRVHTKRIATEPY